MLNYIESKLLALYINWKLNQIMRSVTMKNHSKMTIIIKGLTIETADPKDPTIKVAEVSNTLETNIENDLTEQKHQAEILKIIPSFIKETIEAICSTIPTIVEAERLYTTRL
jgi:predicted transport protein